MIRWSANLTLYHKIPYHKYHKLCKTNFHSHLPFPEANHIPHTKCVGCHKCQRIPPLFVMVFIDHLDNRCDVICG